MVEQNVQNESIEELKNVVSFLADTGEAVERVLEDGKVEGKEITEEGFKLLMKSSKLMGFPKALEQRKLLVNPAKRTELVDFFKRDFELQDEEVEELVEDALEAINKVVGVGQKAVRLRKRKAEQKSQEEQKEE